MFHLSMKPFYFAVVVLNFAAETLGQSQNREIDLGPML
jgi:hypothetical protein